MGWLCHPHKNQHHTMDTKKYSMGNELIKGGVVIIDFVILNVLLLLCKKYLDTVYPLYFSKEPRITFIIANVAMVIAHFCIGTIIHRRRTQIDEVFLSVLKLCLVHITIMFFCLRLLGGRGSVRMFKFMVIFLAAELTIIFICRLLEKLFIKFFRQSGRNTRSVLFVGSDPALLMLYRNLISDSSTGYKIRGYFANELMENCPKEIIHHGTLGTLNQLIGFEPSEGATPPSCTLTDIARTDELFCCLSHDENEQIMRLIKYCDKNLIHFYYVPRMSGNFLLNLQPEQLGETMVFTNHHEPLSHPLNKFIKRTFDIVVSAVVCLVMLPFIPLIAYLIKRQSPGPIFFKQQRTGFNGKTFTCYKFRSMHVNKDADKVQATKDDPRKFPFGDFIRKTNIDEFPQFFNVLKGDMSIVGPRPHMLAHTKEYGEIIDKYMVRHFSLPGITGWAQVSGSRGETKEVWEMEERIQKDIWYIENWTFWLDIRIILRTFVTLFVPDKKAY